MSRRNLEIHDPIPRTRTTRPVLRARVPARGASRALGVATLLTLASNVSLAGPAGAASSAGQAIYAANCAACHGEKGDGKGTLAEYCFPRPRNFTTGVYKFRSTPSGSLPTAQDLMRTVETGIPGTAMPGWRKQLTEAERASVVAYLTTLSPRFATERPKSVSIGTPPAPAESAVASGKGVYEKMGCSACHGPGGRGDGPASATLKDEAGFPIRPFDFTRAGRMRGGDRPEDIYRTFTTGIDGTPMPAFADNLSEPERWQLVHYIRSLGKDRPEEPDAAPIRAAKGAGEAPRDPAAPAWQSATPSVVELHPLWSRDDYVDRVTVRAIVTEKELALLLDWKDEKPDRELRATDQFRDGAAAQFPIDPAGPLPFFGMGHAGAPIEIWHWRADLDHDLSRGPGGSPPDPAALQYADTTHGLERDKTFLTAVAAGNPLALRARAAAGDKLAAAGPGTSTARPAAAQDVVAHGVHENGRWRVVLVRALATAAAPGFALSPSSAGTVPVAFALWDGSMRDRNGQKSVSNWEKLEVGGAQSAR